MSENLIERDQKHLWHPLTQHKLNPKILGIKKAKGAVLTDENGNEYIDGICSWYTSVYGHCNSFITKKVAAQMQQLDQVVFTGFTHEPAVKLSEALIEILSNNQQKIFYNDNGSTATEIGMKMALQFHHNQGTNRKTLVAFENAFHGDTFGAMSASDLDVFHGAFKEHFIAVNHLPVPNGQNTVELISTLNKIHSKTPLAGFIYEPLVQGAAAMKMHDAEGLNAILEFCKNHGIITIADEVMTGFGKTGKNFASDYLSTKPDIICMSKALTAGLLPMGATSCTQEIFDGFYDDDITKGLFHAHTYSANPLACTAALAGIELLRSEGIQQNIKKISKAHSDFTKKIKTHPKVKNIRQQGVIYAFDLAISTETYSNLRNQLYDFFMGEGVYLRPLGNTIYLVPPFIISDAQLQKIYASIEKLLEDFGAN